MKKKMIPLLLLLSVSFAQGQVFIGTKPTENPALLEVSSNNRGVLFPRMNIPNTSDAAPVKKPRTGLFVMNTHPGNEGLFFWNGQVWEKLKTVESALSDLLQTGCKSIFIGVEKITKEEDRNFIKNNYLDVSLKPLLGEITDNGKSYTIQEEGIYEISAGFTANTSKTDAIIIISHVVKANLRPIVSPFFKGPQ